MTSVTDIKPFDTSFARDNGIKALILLAHSLGWNVIQRPNAPVRLRSLDGHSIELIDVGGYRASFFQSKLSGIIAHSTERTPTIELIDKVVRATKPNQDQARRLRLALGEDPKQHRERLANDKPAEMHRDEPHLTQKIEVPTVELEWVDLPIDWVKGADEPPVPKPEPAPRERLVVDQQEWQPKKARLVGAKPAPVIVRTWNDGSVDYKCKLCSFHAAALQQLIGHQRKHAYETPRAATFKKPGIKPQPKPVEEPIMPEPVELPSFDEPTPAGVSAVNKLKAIEAIVATDLMANNVILVQENERLAAENKQLRDNLQALKELIGGIALPEGDTP